MIYRFRCNACSREADYECKINDYSTFKKTPHECKNCGKVVFLERVFEPFEGQINCPGYGVDSSNNWH